MFKGVFHGATQTQGIALVNFKTIESQLMTLEKVSFGNCVVSGQNVQVEAIFSHNNPFVFSDSRAPLNCLLTNRMRVENSCVCSD